ncbi:lamin-B receptor, partial [Silurus asotus]
MPIVRFQAGDTVMGRWPGSNLYYEVKVLSYSAKSQLYTVIYKDGTELELKDADIKVFVHEKLSISCGRGKMGRGLAALVPAPVLLLALAEVVHALQRERLAALQRTPPRDAKTNLKMCWRCVSRLCMFVKLGFFVNKIHIVCKMFCLFSAKKRVKEESENQVSSRYNLRRRKDQGEEPPIEQKNAGPVVLLAAPQQTSKTIELEFGGRIGAFFLLLLLPVVVLALLILCGQKDCSLLSFPRMLPPLDSLWDWQVFGITLLWLLFQAVLSLLPIGKVVNGMPLKNGETLTYRINGFYALLISGVAVGTGVYNDVDLGYIHAHFLQFYTSALLISILLSIYLFVRSRWTTDDERAPAGNSGYVIYDFFMGRELNPRIKSFDIKFFCEMRPGLIGWLVINFAMLHAEMKLQNLDTPSSAMLLVNIFQLLWVADGLWHEEKLLTMMDIVYDGFGFMLVFGDLAWVPFTFTCQSYYLASHSSDLSVFWILSIILMNSMFVFFIYLKTIPTATEKSLIASGLWGFVRHPNYLGDLLMALAWSLTCGFNHIIPYFYVIYLLVLLAHREARDEHQCRKKYGVAWDQYCKAVPYRVFPWIY